ncbi:hypothetical protein L1987_49515 [Smallanthus sonchifolius]|uniref:Uncharacterized protein n=1 Tax=Smallanthus sonchifolius TaxID=185202 RepID=A0ACB9FVW9_9ASTR|nr:hypothetical protein L1987_49515 [Smallanthus sonchifolius]
MSSCSADISDNILVNSNHEDSDLPSHIGEPLSPINWSDLMLKPEDLDEPLRPSPIHVCEKARKSEETELLSDATRKNQVIYISSDLEPDDQEGGVGPIKEAQLSFKKRKLAP